jgi:hypothetical protein
MKKTLFVIINLAAALLFTGCDLEDLLSEAILSDGSSDEDYYDLCGPNCVGSASCTQIMCSSYKEYAYLDVSVTNTCSVYTAYDVNCEISFTDGEREYGTRNVYFFKIGPNCSACASVTLEVSNPPTRLTEFIGLISWYDEYDTYYETTFGTNSYFGGVPL